MIDASIPLGVKPFQLESPVNALSQVLQLQQAQQGNQLRGMQMQEMQRGQAGESALARLLSQGGTPEDVAKGLATQGYGKQSMAYTKQQQDLAKDKMATEKDALANAHKKIEIGSQLLSGATDQATYDQAKAQAQAMGIDFSKLPPQFDPAFVQRTVQQGIDMKTQLEQKWKAMEYTTPKAGDVLQAQTSRENNAATVGASLANAAATRAVAGATREAAGMQRDRDTEMKLGDDYRAQSKDFKAVGDAYKQINATLDKATTSPAATLAAATKFMKLLDPGSVVRESELGMALSATGVFDRATNYVNTLKYGKVLTPGQAEDFKNITRQIYGAAQAGQKQIDAAFRQQAETYKLRPEMVLQDLGQNTPAGQPTAIPKVGVVQDGYRFKGGNPADPKSWEKQ